jgi:hypothetical protein
VDKTQEVKWSFVNKMLSLEEKMDLVVMAFLHFVRMINIELIKELHTKPCLYNRIGMSAKIVQPS